MMQLTLAEIALWTGGTVAADAKIAVRGVSCDTRADVAGTLFVALQGGNFDAHDYLDAALRGGAAAALVSRRMPVAIAQVIVNDTQAALGDLASAMRAQTTARIIGVTGSNGKTTVKTLIASILSLHGKTHVNAGNFNNEIGLPLALLAMPSDTQYAVLEMGAGKPGDIEYLAAIARPEIGLVTNVAPAHLERMGSLENVAEIKGALYSALPPHGVAIVNAEEVFAARFAALCGSRRVLRFGIDRAADVQGEIIELGMHPRFKLHIDGQTREVTLPLAGRHNVMNAVSAAAVAVALDVPIATIVQGLQSAVAVKGRIVPRSMSGGWTLFDDSYNANPGSVKAAIATLATLPGVAWLVLGDMRELGEQAESLHAEIGRAAKQAGIEKLFAVGDLSRASAAAFGAGAEHFADQEQLTQSLRDQLRGGVNILVKGSRGSAMERIVAALIAAAEHGNGGSRHAA